MSNDKKFLQKAFIKHLKEFYDDLIILYPDNIELKTGRTWIKSLEFMNPSFIPKGWHHWVTVPYGNEILKGTLDKMLEKNYVKDFKEYFGDKKTEKEINDYDDWTLEIKKQIKKMDSNNQKKSLKYLQNLCKLSTLYVN
tara:strand:+ start:444 stop:860 length:417 start_codon:yes stop_codon:yes gene_type:complete